MAHMKRTTAVAEEVHRAALRLLRHLRKTDEDFDVSTARLSALSVLVFVGPQSVGSLARFEQVSQPTMTSLTQALQREGFVRSEADATDRRVRRLVATARGKRLLERARAARVAELASMMTELGREERETLAKAARVIDGMLRRAAESD